MYLLIQIVPEVLDNVDIGAIGWPIKFINLLFLEPICSQIQSVLKIIVLLEAYVLLLDFRW